MTKDELDGYLGQVGVPVKTPMTSRVWRCGHCSKDHYSDVPVIPPAPCVCGCIAFRKIVQLPH